jgi:hypothetical protein
LTPFGKDDKGTKDVTFTSNINLVTEKGVTLNQHPQAHHPMDAHYYSIVDEPPTELIFGFILVTNSGRNGSHIWVDRYENWYLLGK